MTELDGGDRWVSGALPAIVRVWGAPPELDPLKSVAVFFFN